MPAVHGTYIESPAGTLKQIFLDQATFTAVTPEVSGSPKAFQQFVDDGTPAIELLGLRYTVNAQDDVAAGSRLLNGYPDVGFLGPNAQVVITADVAITSVHVVAVGNDTAGTPGAGTPIGVVGGLGTDATEAQTRTSMVTFTFDSADNVRTVILTTTPSYTAAAVNATADNYLGLHVEGRSHG